MIAMDPVRKLILEKTAEKQTNLAALSRAIGRNHAYLQQFVKRGVPRHLDEDVRPLLARELGLEEAELKLSSGNGTQAIVNHNEKSVLTPIAPNLTKVNLHPLSLGNTTPADQLIGEQDLPVFGTAQGGRGALIVTDHAVDWVGRPAPLLRVKDGYGMIVAGESMIPRVSPGSVALVNPHLPPRAGDLCIFRRHADDGTVEVCIKEFVRSTDEIWHVKQYNPKKTFPLKRALWQVCHVTVGTYFSR